jgi:transcription termination factor NusB
MKRRKARELALAFIYQLEIRGELANFSEVFFTFLFRRTARGR